MVSRYFVFLVTAVAFVSSATYLKRLPEKPAKFADLPGCYIEEVKAVIKFGEEIAQNGSCGIIGCGRRYIEYATCGLASAEPPCYITEEDVTKPYPVCCPDVKCDVINII